MTFFRWRPPRDALKAELAPIRSALATTLTALHHVFDQNALTHAYQRSLMEQQTQLDTAIAALTKSVQRHIDDSKATGVALAERLTVLASENNVDLTKEIAMVQGLAASSDTASESLEALLTSVAAAPATPTDATTGSTSSGGGSAASETTTETAGTTQIPAVA